MIKKSVLALSAFAFLFSACATNSATEPENNNSSSVKKYSLKEFFKNPEKSSYQISPDGTKFAFMAPFQKRMNIFISPRSGGESVQITEVTDRDIAGYMWANESRILYLKDNGGDENFGLYAVNTDGSNFLPLVADSNVRVRMLDELENQDDYIMIATNERNPQIFDPYRLNIVTGEKEQLAENPGNVSSWMTDHDGKLRLASTSDGVSTSLIYRTTEEDEWKPILTTNFKETLSPLFFTFDNKNVYASSNLGRDKSAIVLFDLETGKEVEELFSHPEVDVSGLSYSKKRQVLTAISYTTAKRHRKFLDPAAEEMFNALTSQLEGYEVAISSMSDDEDVAIVRTYSDRSLGAYYVYEVKENKLTKIDDVSPWIDENDMAEMKPISYTTRDGKTIHGYLTLPKGVEAKNLPVVVNPHGGPWARDNWGFNPEIQFLANRGYAVLQMNFRGSTGYGREFWESSFKQWGQAMQNDITDGVQWLIEEGIADKERIAIYGASYGGYATLAGLAYTPDLYACGVDYVGVSNLFSFMKTIPPYWKPYLEMMYEMVGNPETDSAMMAAYSPALNADKITAPLFIAQGAKDPRVNKAESDQMVEAMKAKGVEVQYMVKNNEGHGFRNEENRFEFYEAMEAFLDKHIGK